MDLKNKHDCTRLSWPRIWIFLWPALKLFCGDDDVHLLTKWLQRDQMSKLHWRYGQIVQMPKTTNKHIKAVTKSVLWTSINICYYDGDLTKMLTMTLMRLAMKCSLGGDDGDHVARPPHLTHVRSQVPPKLSSSISHVHSHHHHHHHQEDHRGLWHSWKPEKKIPGWKSGATMLPRIPARKAQTVSRRPAFDQDGRARQRKGLSSCNAGRDAKSCRSCRYICAIFFSWC